MGDRAARIEGFLARAGWSGAVREPLAEDASFRRYERLRRGRRNAVLMDAPPSHEDVRPFIAIGRHLRSLGYSVPEVYAADVELGALLLEDLGDDLFARVLDAGGDARKLYAHAVDLLIDLQRRELPKGVAMYDVPTLLDEAALFVNWYLPVVGGATVARFARESFFAAWREVLPLAGEGAPVLVLRDYHIDNLMWLERRDGTSRVGLLDFQDALIGPRLYDLVSLLEDARRGLPPVLVEEMFDRFVEGAGLDSSAAETARAILGAQRNTKIIGIFTRLWRRDGKNDYLAYIPRVWGLLEGDLEHPVLEPLRVWFDRHVPPRLRGSSIAGSVASA